MTSTHLRRTVVVWAVLACSASSARPPARARRSVHLPATERQQSRRSIEQPTNNILVAHRSVLPIAIALSVYLRPSSGDVPPAWQSERGLDGTIGGRVASIQVNLRIAGQRIIIVGVAAFGTYSTARCSARARAGSGTGRRSAGRARGEKPLRCQVIAQQWAVDTFRYPACRGSRRPHLMLPVDRLRRSSTSRRWTSSIRSGPTSSASRPTRCPAPTTSRSSPRKSSRPSRSAAPRCAGSARPEHHGPRSSTGGRSARGCRREGRDGARDAPLPAMPAVYYPDPPRRAG